MDDSEMIAPFHEQGVTMAMFAMFFLIAQIPGPELRVQATKAPEPRIVLRVSQEFAAKLVNREVHVSNNIDQFIFGAHIIGIATTSGMVSLLSSNHETKARFTVQFKGTITTKTVGHQKGVQVASSGTIYFQAAKIIDFDGHAFVATPTVVEATRVSQTDGISVPRGLGSGIVRAVADKQVRRLKPQSDQIALRDGKAGIVATFDRQMEQAISDLNDSVPFDDIVSTYFPNARNLEIRMATTKNFLLAAVGQPDAKFPKIPIDAGGKRAPVEICVQYTRQIDLAQKLSTRWKSVAKVISGLTATAADKSPGKDDDKVQGVAFAVAGEWLVFRIGEGLALNLLDDD
jgi:hypothetical protein